MVRHWFVPTIGKDRAKYPEVNGVFDAKPGNSPHRRAKSGAQADVIAPLVRRPRCRPTRCQARRQAMSSSGRSSSAYDTEVRRRMPVRLTVYWPILHSGGEYAWIDTLPASSPVSRWMWSGPKQ